MQQTRLLSQPLLIRGNLKKKKKLGWNSYTKHVNSDRLLILFPCQQEGRQSCKTLHFLCFPRQTLLNYTKLTGPLRSETRRRVVFLVPYS